METGKHVVETLVTGATGFIGPYLVSALAAHGHRVRVLALATDDTSHLEKLQAKIFRGDVREPETLIEPFAGVHSVFNLAAVHGLWRPYQLYYDVNVAGTENVCRAALTAGVRRLVHMSTWTIYGFGFDRPVTEDFPLRPFPDTYQITKLEADQIVQRHIAQNNLPATIIRPATIFGPGDRINFGRLADRVRAGKAILIGSGDNAVPLVYISDLVEGTILAAFHESASGKIYNIENDQPLTQKEMFHAIAEELNVKPPQLRVPHSALYALATVSEKIVGRSNPKRQPIVTRYGVQIFGTNNRHSIEKARTELGYAPKVSVRDGMRMAADWYSRNTP
jgi:nucleoside-diphosphate-sugar epimerase